MPESPLVSVIHAALLVAVQLQPPPVATATVPVPAALPMDVLVGVSVVAHGLLNANWLETPLRETPPGPTAATRAS